MAANIRRVQLYVPGNNRKMISGAASFSVDSIIFDLEDAVPPAEKANARLTLREMLGDLVFKCNEICVRINSLSDKGSTKDIDMVGRIDAVDTIVVPKAESRLDGVAGSTGKKVLPVVESPKGMLKLEDIARSSGIDAIAWAGGDMSLLAGGELSAFERNPYVLTKIVLTARAYGLEAIDKVYFDITNIEGLVGEAANARKYGFSGKQVIHPTHITPVENVFTPSSEQLAWAEKVIRAFRTAEKSGRGAIRVDDTLVDEVHVRMAERIIRTRMKTEEKAKK